MTERAEKTVKTMPVELKTGRFWVALCGDQYGLAKDEVAAIDQAVGNVDRTASIWGALVRDGLDPVALDELLERRPAQEIRI